MRSFNRLVHNAIMFFECRTIDGTFRYNAMTCFLPEAPSSRAAIEAFMEKTFDILISEIDRVNVSWRVNLNRDAIETVVHDGLRFTARVDRFRRFVKRRNFANSPESDGRPGPRWPAGPLRPGSPRTEAERLAFKLN